jgi:hypothetical protein
MTRTVRARRAERPHRPLYARALRLRHLAPSGLLCFVFLEGAVVLGILLALAELVSWWGVVVLPITVALMVKFNDLVAGALSPRPEAGAATSARASVLRPAAMGQSGGAAGSGVTPSAGAGSGIPAGSGPAATGGDAGFGGRVGGNGPVVAPFAERGGGYAAAGASFADRSGHAEWSAGGAGYAPVVSQEPSAVGYGHAVSPDAPAVGYPGSYSRGLSSSGTAGGRSYDGAAGYGDPGYGDAAGYPMRASVEPAVEEPRGTNAPVRRAWADELDVRQQMARQAASRRYE